MYVYITANKSNKTKECISIKGNIIYNGGLIAVSDLFQATIKIHKKENYDKDKKKSNFKSRQQHFRAS